MQSTGIPRAPQIRQLPGQRFPLRVIEIKKQKPKSLSPREQLQPHISRFHFYVTAAARTPTCRGAPPSRPDSPAAPGPAPGSPSAPALPNPAGSCRPPSPPLPPQRPAGQRSARGPGPAICAVFINPEPWGCSPASFAVRPSVCRWVRPPAGPGRAAPPPQRWPSSALPCPGSARREAAAGPSGRPTAAPAAGRGGAAPPARLKGAAPARAGSFERGSPAGLAESRNVRD